MTKAEARLGNHVLSAGVQDTGDGDCSATIAEAEKICAVCGRLPPLRLFRRKSRETDDRHDACVRCHTGSDTGGNVTWVLTKYGFYSVVCARQGDSSFNESVDLNRVMVCARTTSLPPS